MIICMAVINFVLAVFFEVSFSVRLRCLFLTIHNELQAFVVDYVVFIRLKKWLRRMTSTEKAYEKILRETESTSWLPNNKFSASCEEIALNQKRCSNGTAYSIETKSPAKSVSCPTDLSAVHPADDLVAKL